MGVRRIDLSSPGATVVHLRDAPTKVGKGIYRKRILRYGAWNHKSAPGGVLKVDRAYGDALAANFAGQVLDGVKIVKGHPASEAEALSLAAGDILGVEATDDGVYAILQPSADAAAAIDAGDIVGCSAGILPDYTDHEVGGRGAVGPVLEHLALTNTPYIKGLGAFSPVHLAEDSPIVVLSLDITDPTNDPEGKTMDRTELLAKAKELGIDIEALEADAGAKGSLEAELETVKAELAKAPKPEAVTEAETTGAEKGEAAVVAALSEALGSAGLIKLSEGSTPDLKTVVSAVATELAAGRQSREALALSEAGHEVDELVRAGRILPAQREAMVKVCLSDHDTFKALVPEKPVVDLSEHGTTGAPTPNETTVALSDGTAIDLADEVDRLLKLAD